MPTDPRIVASSPARSFPTSFFLLTFILSAPFYALTALAYLRIVGEPAIAPIFIVSFTIAPLASATILTLRKQGSHGVRELLRRTFDFKRIGDRRWYAPTLFLAPLILLLSLGVMVVSGKPMPPSLIPLWALPAAFLLFFLMAVGEEIGWMGYAFEPMQQGGHALRASLELGAIWALWHVPIFVFLMPDPVVLASEVLTLVGNRVLVAWIFSNTGRSVFATILLHAADNTALVTLPEINANAPWGPVALCGLTLLAALGVTALWGPRSLDRYRFGRSAGSQ